MTVISDKADIQVESHVAENNDARERGASPTLQYVLHHQDTDTFCKKALENVGQANAWYTVNKNRLIVRMAPIDGAVQVVVAPALRSRLMYQSNYAVMAGHSGQRGIYDSARRAFHLPHVVNDVYTTAINCSACARTRRKPKLK